MFLPGWHIWCIFFLRLAACGLEISENSSDGVICSQGLSDCTMRNELSLPVRDDNSVEVQKLKPYLKLCCQNTTPCALCLGIDIEVNIHPGKDENEQDELHSGQDEEDYNEEARIPKESVMICYHPVNTIPVCKRVEFTINPSVAQRQHSKISLVITRPSGISFGSHVIVYSLKPVNLRQKIIAPSLDEVCFQMPEERVEQCHVPKLSTVINREMNRVELQPSGSNKSLLSMCVQHENNGRCQRWNRTTIPLYSVTTCMCFQVWKEEDQRSRRSLNCPFNNTDFSQRNVWLNVSVSLAAGQMNNFGSMLWWNLSAPCRLKGEVWPCQPQVNCGGRQGLRQQLTNGTWRQDRQGQWVRIGMFEDVDAQLLPCVMVQVEGMRNVLGPFCLNNTDRWRWSLLIVGFMLLVGATVLIVYVLHDSVKKWAWSWRHGGFVKIGGKRHVVLLSPPDADDGVSESVCRLGSMLSAKGFSVSVDQWSREMQCTLGPTLWLHSQLLEQKNQGGGRVVLVLTHKALERVEEWMRWHKEAVRTKGEDRGLSQSESPYSDAFMACLCLIQGEKQMGKAGERFVLVKFDSNPSHDKTLPELFQGLLLFHLPSQTHNLLTELTVSETGRGPRRRLWTGLKWSASEGLRTKNAEEAKLQNVLLI